MKPVDAARQLELDSLLGVLLKSNASSVLGDIQFVNFDEIAKRAARSHPDLVEQVEGIVEGVLADYILDPNLYFRVADGSYVILFVDPQTTEGSARKTCRQIESEILHALIADARLSALDMQIGVGPLTYDEFRKRGRSVARVLREEKRKRVLPPPPPPVEPEPAEYRYFPIQDLAGGKLLGYWCRQIGGRAGKGPLRWLDDSLSLAEARARDIEVLEHNVVALLGLPDVRTRPVAVSPISFRSIKSERLAPGYFAAFDRVPAGLRGRLSVEVVDIHPRASRQDVDWILSALRRYFTSITVTLPAEVDTLDNFRGVPIASIGTVLAPGHAGIAGEKARLKQFARMAAGIGRRCHLLNVDSPETATDAAASGFRYGIGPFRPATAELRPVELPPKPDAPPPARASNGPGGKSGRASILVVEDNDLIRDFLLQTLEVLGHQPLGAVNADEALVILEEMPAVDLLFTDVVLGNGTDGYGLADLARSFQPDIKVLFSSGYATKAVEHRRAGRSSSSFIRKPYRRADLERMLDGLLQPEAASLP